MEYPTIHIIYDDRTSSDYERLLGEFITQNIQKYRFWEATVLTHSVVESISESFKKIIRWAKENNKKEILIAEQDLQFTNPKSFEYFLKNKPKDYDVYISGSYLIDNRLTYKEPIIEINEWVGNQLVFINHTFYDKWLEAPSKDHCDTVHRGNGKFYCCFPFPALQRAGYSANHQTNVDYNPVIPKEYIY